MTSTSAEERAAAEKDLALNGRDGASPLSRLVYDLAKAEDTLTMCQSIARRRGAERDALRVRAEAAERDCEEWRARTASLVFALPPETLSDEVRRWRNEFVAEREALGAEIEALRRASHDSVNTGNAPTQSG